MVTLLEAPDMSARVGASMLQTLGLPELIAGDLESYRSISIDLAANKTFFADVRTRLVDAADSTKDKSRVNNPLWNMARYVKPLPLPPLLPSLLLPLLLLLVVVIIIIIIIII